MLPGNALSLLAASAGDGSSAYQISRSLRFNAPDGSFCSRTPASAGNRRTFTLSAWVKRSALGTVQSLFSVVNADTQERLMFNATDDKLYWVYAQGTAYRGTDAVFRDVSAWYHIIFVSDTNNGTASERIRFYVNGVQQLTSGNTVSSGQQWDVNNTVAHRIGNFNDGGSNSLFFNGYLADVHLIDGQALDPSSFAETNATTGQWVPKAYSGSGYGTNGFQLKFADNSSNTATTLGKDSSPNGNNFTPNNFSVLDGRTSVAAATGALPIYNTTGTYGDTKGTGTRTDSNSSSINLALPMDGTNNGTTFTDESATIRGSGSARTITRAGDTKTVTASSKFYGSSAYFDGSGDYLRATGLNSIGTGNHTIECWFYLEYISGQRQYIFDTRSSSGGTGAYLIKHEGDGWYWTADSASNNDNSVALSGIPVNAWLHVAIVRNGTSGALYVNGILASTTTGNSGSLGSTEATVFAALNNGVPGKGYCQDFRMYSGLAKYTSNFTPPSSTQNATVAAGNDSLVDTPTSYGTDTGVGGEVRGNYATLNPLKNNSNNVLSNGNLTVVNAASSTSLSFATIALPKSGKYYFEGLASANGGSTNVQIGVFSTDHALTQTGSKRYWYLESGTLYVDNTLAQTVATYGNSDLIGVAYNADANTVTWYKNGVQQGTAISVDTSYEYVFGAGIYRGQWDLNFGQRAFAYTAPSGFKALVDTNLPAVDPAVAKGSSAMDVVLYTGNGAARNITGLAFNPDLVWIKARSIGYDHRLADSVRGVGKELYSNNASTETTNDANGYVSAFNSDGFALQSGIGVNGSGNTYVAWTWDGGTSTVTNNSGTISSQVRANPAAGFSVVTYTGSSTNNIVGHGLGVTPALVIVKPRTTNDFWVVYHLALNDLSKYLVLSSTAAAGTASNYWGTSGNWSSTTFGVYSGGGGNNNLTNVPTVAYCWAPVAGYSSFGSYVGNGSGSNDGPFVYTGFRPKWVMVKASSSDPSGGGWWNIIDATRNTYNAATNRLGANSSSAENSSYQWMDLLSNGFKLRELLDGSNVSGVTYIYAAFAENPFQYARAR